MKHETPDTLRYTKEHEWVRMEAGHAVVGITDFAQDALTDVVYVELPKVGRTVKANESLCVVESVKSVSDVYAPVAGKVVKVNERLVDEPGLINSGPYGDGWICALEPADPVAAGALMTAAQYAALTQKAGH